VLQSKEITLKANSFLISYISVLTHQTPELLLDLVDYHLMDTTREGAGISKHVKLSCILVCYIMIHIQIPYYGNISDPLFCLITGFLLYMRANNICIHESLEKSKYINLI
jgi:hypothetical protein